MINKSDIIKLLSERFLAFTESDVSECVNIILEEIGECLSNNRPAQFRGFGTFKPVVWNMRTGRNPRNGDKLIVPQCRRVHFKSNFRLKENENSSINNEMAF